MYVCVCMYISLICERLYLLVRSEIYYIICMYVCIRAMHGFSRPSCNDMASLHGPKELERGQPLELEDLEDLVNCEKTTLTNYWKGIVPCHML